MLRLDQVPTNYFIDDRFILSNAGQVEGSSLAASMRGDIIIYRQLDGWPVIRG